LSTKSDTVNPVSAHLSRKRIVINS